MLLEVNQRVPGKENHCRLPVTQPWFSLSHVCLYSNCQLPNILLFFVETEAVTAVFNFVDAPIQKTYSKCCMDNRKFRNGSQVCWVAWKIYSQSSKGE
jgi:hypothetical protein